ncbi:MAG: hypothetical protein NTW13_02180, partial [Candidatus Omnitrophica bacterium]|nr:hypothetical protein [Candidatus Omnitrophota bacterium]
LDGKNKYSARIEELKKDRNIHIQKINGLKDSKDQAEYWVRCDARTHNETIYRALITHEGKKLDSPVWTMVSEANKFYSINNPGKVKMPDGREVAFNSETNLRRFNWWPWSDIDPKDEKEHPVKIFRILDTMFRGVFEGYGFSVDMFGRDAQALMKPGDIPYTVKQTVPLYINGMFVYDTNGAPVRAEGQTIVDPVRKALIGPSYLMPLTRSYMREGKTGAQQVTLLDNGRAIVPANFVNGSEEGKLNKGAEYKWVFEARGLDGKIHSNTVKLIKKIDVKVPQAIVATLKQEKPYTYFLSAEESRNLNRAYGYPAEIRFEEYDPAIFKDMSGWVLDDKYIGIAASNKPVPGIIVEEAKVVDNSSGLSGDKIFGYAKDTNGVMHVLTNVPIGGVFEGSCKVTELSLKSREKPLKAGQEPAVNNPALKNLYRRLVDLSARAQDANYRQAWANWLDKETREMAEKREEARTDSDNKLNIAAVIEQYDTWRTDTLTFLSSKNSNNADMDLWQPIIDELANLPKDEEWKNNPEVVTSSWEKVNKLLAKTMMTEGREGLEKARAILADAEQYNSKLNAQLSLLDSNDPDYSIAGMQDKFDKAKANHDIAGMKYWSGQISTAQSYYIKLTGTGPGSISANEDYIQLMSSSINPNDNIISVPEAEAYLVKLENLLGPNLEKANARAEYRTQAIEDAFKLLYAFRGSRDNLAQLVDEIGRDAAKLQEYRQQLYAEAKAIQNEAKALEQKYPGLSLYTQQE